MKLCLCHGAVPTFNACGTCCVEAGCCVTHKGLPPDNGCACMNARALACRWFCLWPRLEDNPLECSGSEGQHRAVIVPISMGFNQIWLAWKFFEFIRGWIQKI